MDFICFVVFFTPIIKVAVMRLLFLSKCFLTLLFFKVYLFTFDREKNNKMKELL